MRAFRVRPTTARHLGAIEPLQGLVPKQAQARGGVVEEPRRRLPQEVAAVARGREHAGAPRFRRQLAEPFEVLQAIVAVDFLRLRRVAQVDVDAVGPAEPGRTAGHDSAKRRAGRRGTGCRQRPGVRREAHLGKLVEASVVPCQGCDHRSQCQQKQGRAQQTPRDPGCPLVPAPNDPQQHEGDEQQRAATIDGAKPDGRADQRPSQQPRSARRSHGSKHRDQQQKHV